MKKVLTAIITADSMTVMVKGKPQTMERNNPDWDKALEAVKSGNEEVLEGLFDKAKAIKSFTVGKCEVIGNEVRYNGKPVHNTVVSRIFEFMAQGFPVEGLLNFLSKLQENPSFRCVDQLYNYLERYKLPITEDGDFIGLKAIRDDYFDKYTGKTHKYTVGALVEEPRNQVNDNPDIGCSRGLHLGNYHYVASYSDGNVDRFVLCRVNPKDVVSCPTESSYQKLRVCKLAVIGEIPAAEVREFVSNSATDPANNIPAEEGSVEEYSSEDSYEEEEVCDDPNCGCH